MQAAIITGCSRGLGLALCRQLLSRGCRVIGIARTPPSVADIGSHDGHFSFIRADPLIERALDILGPQTLSRLILINNAGVVTPMAQAGNYDHAEVNAALAINLTAPIMLTNAFLATAKGRCEDLRIVNVSSGAAVNLHPGWGIYAASKAALDHFSRHVALEQAISEQPARIAALYPGVVDTGMQDEIRQSDPLQFTQRSRFEALKNDGDLSSAEEVAQKILRCLAADDFGTEIVLDIRNYFFPEDPHELTAHQGRGLRSRRHPD